MSELVRDHVGLREVARRTEALMKRRKESEIEINLLVERAVERPHRRLARAATRLHVVAEKHQLRLTVLAAVLREYLGPDSLGVVEHERDELDEAPLFRCFLDRALFGGGRRPGAAATEDVGAEN